MTFRDTGLHIRFSRLFSKHTRVWLWFIRDGQLESRFGYRVALPNARCRVRVAVLYRDLGLYRVVEYAFGKGGEEGFSPPAETAQSGKCF